MPEINGIDFFDNNLAYDPDRYKSTGDSKMDKNAFLKILVAQLQHQDPMSPMDDTQFVSQMATFSSLEQMQQLNASFSQSQAFNLVGKLIYAEENNQGFTGIVSSAGMSEGEAYVLIGDSRIKLENIRQVFDSSMITGKDVLEGSAIVGKYVQYRAYEQVDGVQVEKLYTGKVEKVNIGSEGLTLSVNGETVKFVQITQVSDKPIEESVDAETAGEAVSGTDPVEEDLQSGQMEESGEERLAG